MSGAISASTIAAIAAAGVGAVGTGVGIYQGIQSGAAQQQAQKQQNIAQGQATAKALSTKRDSEVAQGAANMAQPDITTILRRASAKGNGLGSTMLTGSGGVDNGSLTLGGATLLGS